jgi:hypothetical protein
MILPVTVPVRVNPAPSAEIEQVTDPGADPFVDGGGVKPLKVRAMAVGTKMPVPPVEKFRWAAFQVVGAWAFPLLTTNVPVSPFEQSKKLPVSEFGAFVGAAFAAPAATPITLALAATTATADRRFSECRMDSPPFPMNE